MSCPSRRSRWSRAAAAVAFAAVVAVVAAGCSGDDDVGVGAPATAAAGAGARGAGAEVTTTTSDPADLAFCDEAGAAAGLEVTAASAHVTSAGDVTTVADRLMGTTIPPWDGLPAEHVVLQCSYADAGTFTVSTLCPDGDVVPVRQERLLVDREGRWTADPFAPIAPDPCAGNR